MFRRQVLALTAVVGVAGCGPGPAVVRTVSLAAFDSVPRLAISPARQVCRADGRINCPLHLAVANWLDSRRYALWEPGREVMIYNVSDTTGFSLGTAGKGTGEYSDALAVGADGTNYLVLDGWRNQLLRFGSTGRFRDESMFPPLPPGAAFGFVGPFRVRQSVTAATADSAAVLEVRRVSSPEDAGRVLLRVPLAATTLRPGGTIAAASLFPVLPVYALMRNGDIVWSAGASFDVQRQTARGAIRWRTSVEVPPIAVSPADVEARRNELSQTEGVTEQDLTAVDSAAAHSTGSFPAIGGVMTDSRGRVLVSGPLVPSRDSVEFLLLDNNGALTGRFRLQRRAHVLLFAGDSLLVHQPTRGEPWEVRWLRMERGK